MTALSTKWHSRIDYLLAFTLICSPWLFHFSDSTIQALPPIIGGGFIIAYSLCTKYELSFFKIISARTRVLLDIITGMFVALSPWGFRFAETIYIPHLIMGLTVTILALTTEAQE
ncbi:MAG: SPW repeat domain-containing protein, partial [Bacteroidia bacterium]